MMSRVYQYHYLFLFLYFLNSWVYCIQLMHSYTIFRPVTEDSVSKIPVIMEPMSREGVAMTQGGQKGRVIGVFTSGGDSQGKNCFGCIRMLQIY